MNKYLNIIVIGFFSILTTKTSFGFSLVVPIFLIYYTYSSRSIILFIPTSLLSIYVFSNEFFYSCILLHILLLFYTLVFLKKSSFYIDFMYVFLINIGLIFFIQNEISLSYLYMGIFYSILCSLVYVIIKYLISLNEGNFSYFEVVAITICLLGSSTIDFFVNIPFIIGCFYAMYFSTNTSTLFSMVFSIGVAFTLIFLYGLEYALFIPFISSVFHLNNIIASFLIVSVSAIIAQFYPVYYIYSLSVCFTCIFFEMTKFSLCVSKVNKKETYEDIYKKSLSILNDDILAFSSFLDMCTKEATTSKEFLKILNDGVRNLRLNYCSRCYRSEKCIKENEFLNNDLKKLILEVKSNPNILSINVCVYNIEMKKSALVINEKINSIDVVSKNKIMSKVFSNISNMLRQFTVDNSLKNEIDYDFLYRIKRSLSDNGYNVCFFDCLNISSDNFSILIGIRGFLFKDIKDDIEEVINKLDIIKVSVIYSHTEKGKVYIKVIPKRSIQIEYATTNIAQGITSGDNLLVSETQDNKTIALICDGMGKGESAYELSNEVILLIEKLLKTTISTYASLQILNTYYQIKQSLDTFSTLDFLEISKNEKKAFFYKLSAAPSYIYHKNQGIKKIENERLPLGSSCDVDSVSVDLEEGDLIIMSSDGVFENVVSVDDFENFISSITYMSVEKITYQIVNYIKKTSRITDDDLSLIVLKINPS